MPQQKQYEKYRLIFQFTVSQTFLAIRNILQNPNTFNRSQETLIFVPPGDQNLTQFSCCNPFEWVTLSLTKLHQISGEIK